ncbi:MAG TPA: SEC-C metal-binding domain-containing protein [Candidatus Latescibacteria bacterium]|nr:SEC-C metal-binding domain-containing protein [Candidatus Latescibacterota bacterium]
MNLFKRFFNKSKREIKRLRPVVAEINAKYELLHDLPDEAVKGKTDEFRKRLADGETLDDLMVEAFAVVKETMRRFTERKMEWDVCGNMTPWFMVPFDVQLVGAIVLHQGKIAEMATGEGKTLVAVLPLYLNALPGKGAHLVTVNDYLARRDASWNGPIYHWLGLSVSVLQDPNANNGIESYKVDWNETQGYHLVPISRREAYACDVTYGRQDQFGFDYLYDNMAWDIADIRHRGFNFAIVDEADQLLIDEARTPLIISGQVPESKSERYVELKPRVEKLVKEQSRIVAELVDDGERLWEAGETYAGAKKLLQAQRGAPKQRKLMRLCESGEVKKAIVRVELDYMRDKRTPELDEPLLYSIDEKNHSAEITDEGRSRLLLTEDKRRFISLMDTVRRIERDENVDDAVKQERLEKEFRAYINETKGRAITSEAGDVVRAIELDEVLTDEQKRVLLKEQFALAVDYASRGFIRFSLTDEAEGPEDDAQADRDAGRVKTVESASNWVKQAIKRLSYPGREIEERISANEYLTSQDKGDLTKALSDAFSTAEREGLSRPSFDDVTAFVTHNEKLDTPAKAELLADAYRAYMEAQTQRLVLPDLAQILHHVEQNDVLSADQKFALVEDMFRVYFDDSRRKFILPDLSENLELIEKSTVFSEDQKRKLIDFQYSSYADAADRIHGMSNLIRAYGLFERDVNYVVQDDKVVIVDEFTGRLQPGRRYSDGLHQALEAKENVTVERDTQTVATITVQNYFRMYDKLAGMTGTAETEEDELWGIYKLEVIVIPTNKPVRRIDLDDVIFRTKREKFNAVVEEVEQLHQQHLPVLIGTRSVETSELLSRMLKRKGIAHSVLNAKYHQIEAEIIAKAGQPDAVTIATNMAGRGTDIKIPRSLIKCDECKLRSGLPESTITADGMTIKDCLEKQPCGLHIIGTERHDARRIDRQLRGRSGRQGDPGASQFFLSLEDDLMRLFGSERIANIMTRLGAQEGEVIQSPLVTKAIDRNQRTIEANNFEIRKRLLDYDDVMNQQREVIYDRRRFALENDDLTGEIRSLTMNAIDDIITRFAENENDGEGWDFGALNAELSKRFGVEANLRFGPEETVSDEVIRQRVTNAVLSKYEARCNELRREARRQGAEDEEVFVRRLHKIAVLSAVDDRWREHLTDIEDMKGGIHLRQYGQKDPVVEFKREAYDIFENLIREIDRQTLEIVFKSQLPSEREVEARRRAAAELMATHAEMEGFDAGEGAPVAVAEPEIRTVGGRGARKPVTAARASAPKSAPQQTKAVPRVSRNSPCPCGSGKKYKYCHGKDET